MQREKKLLKNIIVFAAGNMGSKLLQFILIPFYTSVLSTAEYGTVDLLQTGSMLLIPIFSLTIAESVFRYGMDNASDKREVFSIGMFTVSIGGILLVLIGGCMSWLTFPVSMSDIWLMIAYTICNMFRTVSSQFLRAIGKTTLFSVDNVVQTGSIVGLNLLFLLKFNMGVSGYMLGYILGNLISFLFGFGIGQLWKYIQIKRIDKETFKKMVFFSVPLIPNTICWWISSSTDKLMITGYVGTAANGIYSIAHKIPSIITVVVGIFIQAWQISANEEFEQKDSGEFYSSVFDVLASLNFIFSSILILFSKLEIAIIAADDYFSAWGIMITLIVGIVFFSFAQFLGTIYTANKKTTMAFVTNLIAALINIVANYLLIPIWGVQGAAIATSFSYLILWVSRIISTRNIVKIQYNMRKILVCSALLIVQAFVQILEIKGWFLWGTLCFIIIIAMNYSMLKTMILKLVKKRG